MKSYGNSNISPWKKNNLHQKKNPLKETKILQDIINSIQISSFKKNSSKRNQKISRYIINSIQISSFNTSQNIIFQKSSYKKYITYLSRGQNPLSYSILYNESKHKFVSLPCLALVVGKANQLCVWGVLWRN
jgi:hypothetical protein